MPPNMRLKLAVRALYIGVHPLWRAARAARSLSAIGNAADDSVRQRRGFQGGMQA